MNKRVKISLATLFVVLFFGSCGNMGHNNFNKRKYTKLKSKQSHGEETASVEESDDDVEIAANYDDFSEESVSDGEIYSEDEFIETKETDESSSLNLAEEIAEDNFNRRRGPQWKERRNFNKLEESEQRGALHQFHRTFNSGLVLMILGILGGILALITLWSGWVWVVGAIAAGTFVFICWIMSMWALNRLRKIDIHKRSRRLRIKFRLAQVVAYIGVTACVVTILGGVVLGILWLLHVITF